MGRKRQVDQIGWIGFDELTVLKSEKESVPPPSITYLVCKLGLFQYSFKLIF